MPRRPWTEADYAAAGVVQCKLRLKAEDLEKLRTLADETGLGLSDWVAEAIGRAWKRRAKKST